jgi:hypothetical protein
MARVDVLWTDEDANPRVTPGTLEDKSRNGVSVRLKIPISSGSHLTVKWGNEQISGIVKHSRRVKSDYVLGILRDAVTTGGRT